MNPYRGSLKSARRAAAVARLRRIRVGLVVAWARLLVLACAVEYVVCNAPRWLVQGHFSVLPALRIGQPWLLAGDVCVVAVCLWMSRWVAQRQRVVYVLRTALLQACLLTAMTLLMWHPMRGR